MTPTQIIYARLSTATAVTALVGNRIYPGESPEDVFPLVVFTVQDQTIGCLSGSFLSRDYMLTVTCEATSKSGVDTLAKAVREALTEGDWPAVVSCRFSDAAEDTLVSDEVFYQVESTFKVMI